MGDPGGIGPEVIVKALADPLIRHQAKFVIFGMAEQLAYAADTGEIEVPGHGMCTRHRHDERWTIAADDPLSHRSLSRYICWMSRGDWSVRTECESEMRCDAENFYIKATVRAYEGDELINERDGEETSSPRDHI